MALIRAGQRPKGAPAPHHSPQEACPAAFRTEPPPGAWFTFLSPKLNARTDATSQFAGSGGDFVSGSGRADRLAGSQASRCLRHLRRPLSSLLQFLQRLATLVPEDLIIRPKTGRGRATSWAALGRQGAPGGPGSGRCQSPRITRRGVTGAGRGEGTARWKERRCHSGWGS